MTISYPQVNGVDGWREFYTCNGTQWTTIKAIIDLLNADINQDVLTTSSPTFNAITLTTSQGITGLTTTDSPTFASITLGTSQAITGLTTTSSPTFAVISASLDTSSSQYIRVGSQGAPASGAGLEFSYGGIANQAEILAYDRTAAAYKYLRLRGLNINLEPTGGYLYASGSGGSGGNGLLLNANDMGIFGLDTSGTPHRTLFLGADNNTYINAVSNSYEVIMRTGDSANFMFFAYDGTSSYIKNNSAMYIEVAGSAQLEIVNGATYVNSELLSYGGDATGYLGTGASRWYYVDAMNINYYSSLNNLSTKKVKENIIPLTNEIEGLMNLKPVKYNYIEDKEKKLHYGFIAEDVEPHFPHMINPIPKTPEPNFVDSKDIKIKNPRGKSRQSEYLKGMDYQNLFALLVKAYQELNIRLQILEAK